MDVRKADSKGRVALGLPNIQYKVHKLGGTVLLEPFIDPLEIMEHPAPKPAQDYLRAFGLDPRRIAIDGANDLGYDEFEYGENGHKEIQYGRVKTIRKPWPEGFDWNVFVQLAVGMVQ